MSFREIFLNKLKERATKVTVNTINLEKMQAFTRKELETGIQLYKHLQSMGNTFEDLIAFIENQRLQETRANVQSAMRSAIYLTREQKKHPQHGGKRSKRQ